MFSSLASYFFGTNTENPNSETRQQSTNANERGQQQQHQQQGRQRGDFAGDVINLTSATPSVTGGNPNRRGAKRSGKNRRSGGGKQTQGVQARRGLATTSPTITKLLTPNESSEEDNFDEAEWFIVDKEDEEASLPFSDSEDDISLVEALQQQQEQQQQREAASSGAAARRRQHISSHSLYSGPRLQQQRNFLQHVRNGVRGTAAGPLSQSEVNSPPRHSANIDQELSDSASDDNGVTQSLYHARTSTPCVSDYEGNAGSSSSSCGYIGANISMEESWYVTPPPCFTSIGPINMEISPFENLLIEHPSMSVYHSIRSAQEATESFVSLDLGVNNEPQQQEQQEQQQQQQQREQLVEPPLLPATQAAIAAANANMGRRGRPLQMRAGNTNARIDHQAAAQLKQEALALSSQKSKNRKDHKKLCRGAIKRANKVRDYQANAGRPRRSDMQHCRFNSGANNNRKGCF